MSLRRKVLLVVGISFLGLLALLYGASRSIVLNGFTSIEEDQVQRNLEGVSNAINDDLASLLMMEQEWAYRDEMYAYALGENEEYAETNLDDSIFVDSQINVSLIVNGDGQILFERGYDLTGLEQAEVPASLLSRIESDDTLIAGLQTADVTSATRSQGIIHLDEGPLLFVALPILRSGGGGPSAGAMLWGRFFDEVTAVRLSERAGMPLSIYTIDDPRMPLDVLAVHRQLRTEMPNIVRPLENGSIAGYSLLTDIDDAPAAIARIELPRTIYQSGEATLSSFLVLLIAVGLVFGAVTLWLVDLLILSRLARLNKAAGEIAAHGNFNNRVIVDGTDELGNLAIHINGILVALQQSQEQLHIANQSTEKRVIERAAPLLRMNGQMKQELEERDQLQRELVLERNEAVESLRVKTEIISTVSHDSRTPLSSIIGYSEMLLVGVYGVLNEEAEAAIRRIMVNAQDLLAFINNLLASSKLESNAIQPQYEVFQLSTLFSALEDTVSLRAREKGLLLITAIDAHLPDQLYSDEQRIKQILTNLTVNAIKFTEQGSVTVRAFRQDETHWALEVQDTGKGIEPEVQERIFEAFWQVDGQPARRNSGVGLGLAIVQALVRLLEGDIKIESEVGRGSTFTVILPLLSEQKEGVS